MRENSSPLTITLFKHVDALKLANPNYNFISVLNNALILATGLDVWFVVQSLMFAFILIILFRILPVRTEFLHLGKH